jgi:hypothetical protein
VSRTGPVVVALLAVCILACEERHVLLPTSNGGPPEGDAAAHLDASDVCAPPQQGVTCIAPLPCTTEGNHWDAKSEPGGSCCPGLVGIPYGVTPTSECDACTPDGVNPECANPPPLTEIGSVCTPCGDGVCETADGENGCNCPQDCPGYLDAGKQD